MLSLRRRVIFLFALIFVCVFVFLLKADENGQASWRQAMGGTSVHTGSWPGSKHIDDPTVLRDDGYFWRKLPTHYPVTSMRPIPTGKPLAFPKIQASFPKETAQDQQIRLKRQKAIKAAFDRCWKSYLENAWLHDELAPISGGSSNPFGGWGATLVDSLDSLYIMGMQAEFEQAVAAAANISFETTTAHQVNVFETTIRYLGGFLAAYDLSGDVRLLKKAREAGDMLYAAFDTPNRMPVARWDLKRAAAGQPQQADGRVLLAEIGSLCLEFTRLSLLTGDPRWFDASERITEALRAQQHQTLLPGLWPISINASAMDFTKDNTFSLGAMADSVFEYLPKMAALTGGLLPHYQTMYKDAMETAVKHNLWRPMVPDEADILISSSVHMNRDDSGALKPSTEYVGQHLVCFAGGMLALGGKLFGIQAHLGYAKKLVDGCVWTYKAMPSGIMPETFAMAPCPAAAGACPWDEAAWKRAVIREAGEGVEDLAADVVVRLQQLPPGFTAVEDAQYILRPEAIESVFILYRATGDRTLLDTAWTMFEAIQRHTATSFANAALADVRSATPQQVERMESFWMGETLKYFYLIFSEPDLISLDKWVFNTEAHPFRRLVP